MLDGFLKVVREKKYEEVKRLKPSKTAIKKLKIKRPSIISSINSFDIPIIAEIKRGSPSSGLLKRDFSIKQLARDFERAGACAISIITDSNFFYSHISYMDELKDISIPILRKDFIFDFVQIDETASTYASSVLLIVRFIDDQMLLRDLMEYSLFQGIEPVIEVFDEEEVEIAKRVGADVIMVNNRDLSTLKVDMGISKRLIKYKENEIWIGASGLSHPDEIKELKEAGFDSFLIGTSIMKSPSPYNFIRFLKNGERV